MKSMLQIALLTTVFAVAALPAARAVDETQPAPPPAGGEKSPEARPRRGPHGPLERLQRMSETLNLTQEQKDQVAAILKENAPQIQAIMNDESLSRDDRRAKMQGLRKDMRARIRAVLTPEQQTKFDAMPRPGWGTRGQGPGHEPPPGTEPPANGKPPVDGNTAAGGSA
jgi:protein CpxP